MNRGEAVLDFHWFLPTNGDSRYFNPGEPEKDGMPRGDRVATVSYLARVAGAAEEMGFQSVLTPAGYWCGDAWVIAAMLTQRTERLKFMVAARPGLISPTLTAQMAATFQNLSGGRLLINAVTGAEDAEQRAYGDFLGKEERYARTAEFLHVLRALWAGETVSLNGSHIRVSEARLAEIPKPAPTIYFAGSSRAALDVGARNADVYLTWGEPPMQVAEKLAEVRARAAAVGRAVRFGVRMNVITRDRAGQAWAEAERLLDGTDPKIIERVQSGLRRTQSVGQRRLYDLHKGSAEHLEVYPNLWAGVGLARGGAGTALVGSHEEVADRILEYHDLGITEFILSGYPHLEEAYWFGEGVLPLLERRGRWSPSAGTPSGLSLMQAGGVPQTGS